MTIDDFKQSLSRLLNEAVVAGFEYDDIFSAVDEVLHPEFALDAALDVTE